MGRIRFGKGIINVDSTPSKLREKKVQSKTEVDFIFYSYCIMLYASTIFL